jgi:hypothetical protein
MKIITTSWDDGAPEEFKLAELLNKYNIAATLYIPRRNPERPVISEQQIRELDTIFEIGGHTLNHVFLTTVAANTQWQEIEGCYSWLSEVLDIAPKSFCSPKGLYNTEIVKMVQQAGFSNLRTTHLLENKCVAIENGFSLLHTTVQLYEHKKSTYFKHLLKRKKISTLCNWLGMHAEKDLLLLTEKQLSAIRKKGEGCFHLWGHSWEIERYELWNKLEAVCKLLSNQHDFSFLQNKEINA